MARPKQDREPSMFDVARVAGVSHQTVSRVLNEHPNVRAETRARVQAAIGELGYRRNDAARALATGRSRVLGVVAPRSTLFGPVSMLAAFDERAAAAGFSVSIGQVRALDRPSIDEAVQRHLDQRVAGLVLLAPVTALDGALDHLPTDVPRVLVNGDPARGGASVRVDQVAGARLATRHLLEAGHRAVWHVGGPADWFDAAGRVAGWEAELRAAGIEPPPPVAGDWTAASGYRAGELLGRMPEVTAVFAANDAMAMGVLRALSELGRAVPGDVSVVGFDDAPESGYLIPPLTTVRQDFDAVAHEALGLLLEQLEGRGAARRVEVPPALVERASVAPPPG